MLDRFVNQVQSSTNPSLDSLKRLAGLDRKKQEKDDSKMVEPEFTEQDGILHLTVAKRMLKWHAEAIGRAVELSSHADLWVLYLRSESNLFRAKDAQTLMVVLYDHIGKAYVEVVLDQ